MMISRPFACSIVLCCPLVGLVLYATSLQAGDWTEFRGSTGQGLSDARGLPIQWTDKEHVTWKKAVAGKGWSSPIILGQRIYLTSAVPGDAKPDEPQTLQAVALDLKTGEKIWERELFHKPLGRIHGKNSHASPTPITDGKRLFVHFGTHGTASLDLDGNILWKTEALKYAPVHGSGGSPVLIEGKVIFSCDGGDSAFVVGLDQETGKEVWRTNRPENPRKKFAFCTPIIIDVEGKPQVVSVGAGSVGAYNPADGKELWHVLYDGGYSVVPRPAYGHGLIYLSTGYDTPKMLAVRPGASSQSGDLTASSIEWTVTRGAPRNASPILIGDELYFVSDNGIACCVDAKTGKEHWQKRLGGDYSSSPIAAEGRIYFLSEEGVTTIVEAGKEFKELARNPVNERTLASYAVADGALFIRTEDHLLRVEQNAQ